MCTDGTYADRAGGRRESLLYSTFGILLLQIERTADFRYTWDIMKQDIDQNGSSVRFSLLAFGFVVFSWSAYALAAAGSFWSIATLSLSVIVSIWSLATAFRWLKTESPFGRIVFVLILTYTTFLLSGSSQSIFSGRDQGAIAEASIELSQNGRFPFSTMATETFFNLYGKGKALNFPGFFYDADGELRSQFPGSYIAWLGAFHSLLGIPGLTVGNGVLLSLSLLTLFILVRSLADEITAGGATLIAIASFLPSWFAKFTLTENLALFLFLYLALSVTMYLRKPGKAPFFAAIITAVLLSVTRIEGLPILAITIAILFLSKPAKSYVFTGYASTRWMTFLGTITILTLDFFANIPRYASIAKAVLHTTSASAPESMTAFDPAGLFSNAASLWKLFLPYGLILPISLGIIGAAYLSFKKNRIAVIPVLLALPTFLYLIDPNISADHPWMLRRLLFSVWPALLVSFSVALHFLFSSKGTFGRNITIAVPILVALAGISPTISAFRFSENGGLLEETASLARTVGDHDLVLIDREATGDPYAIPAGPLRFLFGKNAAYFFNPDDFAKIPKDGYDHVYLLAPADGFERWSSLSASLSLMTVVSFETERLGPLPLDTARFPDRSTATTDSLLFSLDPL
jgi:hypothetical protein